MKVRKAVSGGGPRATTARPTLPGGQGIFRNKPRGFTPSPSLVSSLCLILDTEACFELFRVSHICWFCTQNTHVFAWFLTGKQRFEVIIERGSGLLERDWRRDWRGVCDWRRDWRRVRGGHSSRVTHATSSGSWVGTYVLAARSGSSA